MAVSFCLHLHSDVQNTSNDLNVAVALIYTTKTTKNEFIPPLWVGPGAPVFVSLLLLL